ncbi:MAG: type IV pilus secretin PilQ [Myxococcota bacterium]|nr:type IV pilus secretin PilQ [Myxococcota bacterium]
MFSWKLLMKRGALLVAAGSVAALMACASSQAPDAPQPATDVLSALEVTQDGESTVVTLIGVHETTLDVASHSDPWAISIDLGEVPTVSEMVPVAVYDGTVDQVSAASFTDEMGKTSTRVEIGLPHEAEYELVPSDGGMAVRLVARDVDLSEEDIWEAGADPLAYIHPIDPFAVIAATPISPAPVVPAPAPPPEATRLSDVRFESVAGGVLVHLVANGVIGATESFVLSDPARLVIDLPDMTSALKPRQVTVGAPEIEGVRIGVHSDRVRIVIDGGVAAAGFQGKRMMPVADGMLVGVGNGDAIEGAMLAAIDASEAAWAASAAPIELAAAELAPVEPAAIGFDLAEVAPVEPAAIGAESTPRLAPMGPNPVEPQVAESTAPVELPLQAEAHPGETTEASEPQPVAMIGSPEATPMTVFGIEYETDFDRGVERIAIIASGKIEHDWVAPDAETVVVRILNAQMAPGAEGNIAPRADGPLSLIRAFQQPEVQPAEVRVVVKRAPHLVPRVDAIGSNLFVEFAIGANPAAAPASSPGGEGVVAPLPNDPTAPQMPTGAAAPLDAGLPLNEEAVPPPAMPAPPASLEPPAAIDVLQEGGLIDGKEYRGRRISLDFKGVAIEDVLRLIAEVSDLNIISGDEVTGEVSIRLVDVPWDQALDVILLTKGFGFVRVGNVLRIAPGDVLAQEEEVRLQERRAKEKLEDLVVKLIPVNYGDVKSMERLVKRLLTSRGSVNTDERTSTLIVKDIASVVDEATALVAAVDTETPQVMIEAKIVEANLDFSRELGSVWSVGQQQLVNGFDPNSGTRTDLGGEDFRFAPSAFRDLNESNNVSFINNLTAQPTALFNLSAFLLDEKFNIDVQLQAAESTGNGKVVSSPRVVTLDNSEAMVEQGVSIPFQTFENGDAKLEFVDATLSLRVTPHITSDKSIIMKIEVTRDAPDSTVQTATGSPAIAKNQAKTEALVKDGQTLVLGGIYTIEKTFRQSRVPYLHRIPILGAAFKSKEVSDQRKELLIFVTPRIVLQATS